MTPKEKAKELVDKIYNSEDYQNCDNGCGMDYKQAVDIALICVDEIMWAADYNLDFWEQVKQELTTLNGPH